MESGNLTIKENFIESELKFKTFIEVFLHFINEYFKEISCFPLAYEQRVRMEKNLVSSLMLLEMLHFQQVIRSSICSQIIDYSDHFGQTNHFIYRKSIRKLIMDINEIIKSYQFLDENDKHSVEKILKHLLQYYEKGRIVFDPPVTVPWIANHENIYPYPYYWGKENES